MGYDGVLFPEANITVNVFNVDKGFNWWTLIKLVNLMLSFSHTPIIEAVGDYDSLSLITTTW